MARVRILLAALALSACVPAQASAAPAVVLRAALIPERLGEGTTIRFAFSISFPAGQTPVALRELHLRYPANLGIATSGLGVSTCRVAVLEADGPPGCPRNVWLRERNAVDRGYGDRGRQRRERQVGGAEALAAQMRTAVRKQGRHEVELTPDGRLVLDLDPGRISSTRPITRRASGHPWRIA
jgi:hypothetical protein